MENHFRTSLEEIVLELQKALIKASFEADVLKEAQKYYKLTYYQKKAIANIYQEMFNFAIKRYEEAVKEEKNDSRNTED